MAVVTDGRRDRGMPGFKDVLDAEDIDEITTYIENEFKGKPVIDP